MTYNPEQAVITCDTPGCRYRLYTMDSPQHAERWTAAGGTIHPAGRRHACYRHANKEGADQS